MLRFILGCAGVGKTAALIERVADTVRHGKRAVLLVPEQYSFEAERLVYRRLGPKEALGVEVLSFTRLCNSVFRRFGGLAQVAVSEAGKYMLMSVALGELKDMLSVYRKSAANTAFVQTMVRACAEFKSAGVDPEKLEEIASRCDNEALREKLAELGTVYAAYQALLARGYTDPDDELLRVCELLRENNFFAGYEVFVDGFTTFMAAEFMLLGHVVRQANEATFAFTADSHHDEQKGVGIFSPAKGAVARLMRYAREAGVPVETPVVLPEPLRYRSGMLRHIARYFPESATLPYEEAFDGSIRFCEVQDPYAEMEYAAAEIRRLVCDEGYRYREIAVVARDIAPYLRAAEAMFARYGIPYFCDTREEAENHPLISGLLAALEAARGNFDAGDVLEFAKSPVNRHAPELVAQLENYCYSWGVRGALWTQPFQNNPRGLAEGLTEADTVLLAELNALRERLIGPLQALKEALRAPDGKSFAQALYDLLESVGAGENLTAFAQSMPQGDRESFLDMSAQLWDALIEVLDVFGAVLGGARMQAQSVCDLFRLAVATLDAGQVPQTLDEVLFGGADRIRPGEVRAVFVVGLNEGVFPPLPAQGGVFSESERRELAELGAELARPVLEQAVLERYFGYFAFTLPSERLYALWARADTLGNERQPSIFARRLRELFPAIVPAEGDDHLLIGGDSSAFAHLAAHIGEDTPQTTALLSYFSGPQARETLTRMEAAMTRPPHRIYDRAASRALFGGSVRLTPSRVERYYRCPFSYFAAEGLVLRKRRKVEFTPLESGSVIHNVLQVMVQRHGGKGLALLSREQLQREVRAVIEDYIAQRVENLESLPRRFKYLFTRLTGMLARLLAHIGQEFAQSAFEPVAFELPINHKDGVKPLRLETPDGVPVSVEGFVDRVDLMKRAGKRYIRVVDYKSGGKDFALGDVLYGLNMQMLLYLFTLAENGTGELAGAVPAGVLYMPAGEKFTPAARGEEPDHTRQWRMNGLLLEDDEALRGMEQELAGVFIPVKAGKGGDLDARSSLASYEEMGQLAHKVRAMVVKMADALAQGGIESYPVQSGDYNTCENCDYRAVCGFEAGDAVKSVEKLDRAKFFAELRKEEEAHG